MINEFRFLGISSITKNNLKSKTIKLQKFFLSTISIIAVISAVVFSKQLWIDKNASKPVKEQEFKPQVVVKQTLEERTKITLASFGIKSTNTPERNDVALKLFNSEIKGRNKPKFFIDAKNLGLIKFTWNQYLSGVIDFVFDFSGTQLQCVNSSAGWGEQQPIINSTFYYGDTRQPYAGKKIIRTALPGDTKFYISPLDKNFYTVGRQFFVGADERQFYGWPPNFLVSEWHKVKTTGKDSIGTYVETENPIEKLWSVNYYDNLTFEVNGFGVGKPRVWFTDNYTEYAEFNNGEFLANPNTGKGSFLFKSKILITNNVRLGAGVNCNASENKIAIYKNLVAREGHEIDKSVGYVEYNGGSSGWMQTAGAEKLVLRNHKMTHGNNLSADFVDIQNCELNMQGRNHPALYPHPEGRYTKEYILKNYRITGVVNPDGQSNLCHRMNFEIDGLINQTNGSDIIFPAKNAREGLAKVIYPDCLLWSYNQETNLFKLAKVSHIESDGERFVIKNVGANWAKGDIVYHSRVGYIKDLGGNTSDKWGSPFFSGTDLRWKGNKGTNKGRRTTVFEAKDFKWLKEGSEKKMILDGTIHSITINILKKLPGSIIWYKNHTGDWTTSRIFEIKLNPGKRIITKNGVKGGQKDEYFNVRNIATFIQDIPYSMETVNRANLDNLFTITLDWTPY